MLHELLFHSLQKVVRLTKKIKHFIAPLNHMVLQVTFVGEGAIDQGGPKREFFRLFAEQACTYFRGDDKRPKFLRNDILAVQVFILLV